MQQPINNNQLRSAAVKRIEEKETRTKVLKPFINQEILVDAIDVRTFKKIQICILKTVVLFFPIVLLCFSFLSGDIPMYSRAVLFYVFE